MPAQQLTNAPADTNSVVANTTQAGQAPDDVIKKLSDLTHAGKYPEAQQLAAGLLLVYPGDQRLIKPPISCVLSDDKRTITMVFPQRIPAYGAEETTIEYASQHPVTFVFEKNQRLTKPVESKGVSLGFIRE